MLGSVICSVLFAVMIAIPGNNAWQYQDELVHILGSTPRVAFASVFAFWVGDYVNDVIFKKLKERDGEKRFGLRAILSSLAGKYVDGAIFTLIGLSFLPMSTKINMIINCPFVQVCIELLLLPVTYLFTNWLRKKEV